MDSYNHYLIAKNTWKHPNLFLDQWGKPVYNIIASPFVQFGINGATVLNILCLVLSSLLAYKCAQRMNLRYSFLAYVLTLISPIFLDNTLSSLTEPLCALLVVWTIYLSISNQFVSASILAGILPFARSEGFIVLFAVALYIVIIKRQYKYIFFLTAGSVFFNTLGWIIEGDPFWIFTQNPYINFQLSGRNVCGNGGIGHYYYALPYTFGTFTSLLVGIAAFFFMFKVLTHKSLKGQSEYALILLSAGLYFLAHVFIWWLGMMGSCGYIRVMTVISPLIAVLATVGLHHLFKLIPGYKLLKTILVSSLILYSIWVPYRFYAYKYPLKISAEQEQYEKLLKWYEQQEFENRTKIYLYPYFSIIADIDPYDQTQHLYSWPNSREFSKVGDILIWDSHFGPHESGTPLDTLLLNDNWQRIHSIIPNKKIPTVNDAPFQIHVFEKIK